jgi:DNA-binding Lrp family transcriptional regulator
MTHSMTSRTARHSATELTPLQQSLLSDYQRNLPLSATPYADIAVQLGVSEHDVIENLKLLQEKGYISRVGPVFRPNRVGVSTLAAMAVPEHELEQTADVVSAFSEVNHNYQRDHAFNLWFVVTACDDDHLAETLDEIERQAGFALMSLPMLEDYHIDLGFKLPWE